MRRAVAISLAIAVVAMIGFAIWRSGTHIAPNSVLAVELAGSVTEAPSQDFVSRMFSDGPALPTLILQLDMAAADDRIAGVLVHIRALSVSYAQLQELRDALKRVRHADKKVVALLDLGRFNATREYYLASAADEIYVVNGFLGPLAGIAGQYLHLAGLFDRLGVEWEYSRVGAYKSAVEMFANSEMSDPARENATELIDGIFGQVVAGIAEGRGLEQSAVRKLIDAAPATASEYVEAGLADGIAEVDDVLERAGLGKDTEPISTGDYAAVSPTDVGLRGGPVIAIVFGEGTITQTGGRGPFGGSGFSSDAVADAIEVAAEDEDVAAIVLRVNSPGGSPLASDQLYQAIRRAREEKPVVVSMSAAAASGGYYVAAAADAIVAEPATFTGSIGVFFLRPVTAGLYTKLGIHTELISRGSYASVAGSDLPQSEDQKERSDRFTRALYDEFVRRVSEGRTKEPEQVDAVGQGRVWLGSHALAHGLVDKLGGLHEAVLLAKTEAGIDADVDPARVVFPGPRSLGQQLRDALSGELPRLALNKILTSRAPAFFDWLPLAGEPAFLPEFWIELE